MFKSATTQPSLHVLTLAPFYPHEGNEADGPFVAEPLRYMAEFGVQATVLAAKPVSHSRVSNNGTEPPAVWVRHWQLPGRAAYPSWGPLLYLRLVGLVRQLHRERRIDLIHAHCALPCGQPAAQLARDLGIPFVVTIHGVDAFSLGREQGLSRWWCDRASRGVYRRANQNICVSGAVQREITTVMGSTARTVVVYNGVDAELFSPSVSVDEESSVPTILSVARLAPVKRLSLMLRAFAKLAPQFPTLRYEIIGEGQELTDLTALAAQLNIAERVAFLGRRSRREVAEAMRRCTIFALPSQEEALGCVYLEAMATGKPTVACRNQAIAEIIRHGQTGWLVEADDLEDLACGLAVLLEDAALRKRLGDAARPTMIGGFTLRHQTARLVEVYKEVLGDKSSSSNL